MTLSQYTSTMLTPNEHPKVGMLAPSLRLLSQIPMTPPSIPSVVRVLPYYFLAFHAE